MQDKDAYAHARHAGNAGDVFKHVALAALLEALPAASLYIETHAGDGLFTLGSVGEWTAGAAKLWGIGPGAPPDAIDRWLEAARSFSRPGAQRPERYPGSPLIARALLPARASLLLHELSPLAAQVLRRALTGDDRAEVLERDGLAALPDALARAGDGAAVALIDPPYAQKPEWDAAARGLAAGCTAAPGASFLLWYPIKALTRPRALLAQLARLGVHGTAVELITTPLRLQRDRLNGSGLIFVGAPLRALQSFCSVLPRLGPALSTHGEWTSTQIGF
jgi:23S rRNA (adenine2030-N6)-methyltransferase